MDLFKNSTRVKCRVERCVHHGGGLKCNLGSIMVSDGSASRTVCQDFKEQI